MGRNDTWPRRSFDQKLYFRSVANLMADSESETPISYSHSSILLSFRGYSHVTLGCTDRQTDGQRVSFLQVVPMLTSQLINCALYNVCCAEALRDMQAVAEHMNEMQKIYDEYGAVFDALSSDGPLHCRVIIVTLISSVARRLNVITTGLAMGQCIQSRPPLFIFICLPFRL